MGTRTEKLQFVIEAKDQASKSISNVQAAIAGAFGGVAAGLVQNLSAKLVQFTKDVVNAGIEEEKQWNRVSQALRQHKIDVEQNLPTVQKMTDLLEEQTGQADELISQGFNRLVSAGYSVAKSYDMMKAASDLAAGANMDLGAAVNLLIKAGMGNVEMFQRYGIEIDKTVPKGQELEAVLKAINAQFGGQAKASMEGAAGAVANLGIQWERFMENIAPPVLDVLTAINTALDNFRASNYDGVDLAKSMNVAAAKVGIDEIDEKITNLVAQMGTLNAMGGFLSADKLQTQITALQEQRDVLQGIVDAYNLIPQGVFEDESIGIELANLSAMKYHLMLAQIEQDYTNIEAIPFVSDYESYLVGPWEEGSEAADEYAVVVGTNIPNQIRTSTIPALYQMHAQATATANGIRESSSGAARAMSAAMSHAASSIVDSMYGARMSLKKIWNDMAADMIKFFIKAALEAVAAQLVKGIVRIIGAIFDTPANDQVAFTQGLHVAQWMTRGLQDGMAGFKSTIVSSVASPISTAGGGDGPRGMSSNAAAQYNRPGQWINNHFYGTVVTDESYIHKKVLPQLTRKAHNGGGYVQLRSRNATGGALIGLT